MRPDRRPFGHARRQQDHEPPTTTATPAVGDTLTGTVARVILDRGFCFINAAGQDYFCHFTALQDGQELRDLIPGVTKVRFIVNNTAKGVRAEQVEVLGR